MATPVAGEELGSAAFESGVLACGVVTRLGLARGPGLLKVDMWGIRDWDSGVDGIVPLGFGTAPGVPSGCGGMLTLEGDEG